MRSPKKNSKLNKSLRYAKPKRSLTLRAGWTSVPKSDPVLWEKVLKSVRKLPGRWAAWKSMKAVKMYKDRGGKYNGSRKKRSSLKKLKGGMESAQRMYVNGFQLHESQPCVSSVIEWLRPYYPGLRHLYSFELFDMSAILEVVQESQEDAFYHEIFDFQKKPEEYEDEDYNEVSNLLENLKATGRSAIWAFASPENEDGGHVIASVIDYRGRFLFADNLRQEKCGTIIYEYTGEDVETIPVFQGLLPYGAIILPRSELLDKPLKD